MKFKDIIIKVPKKYLSNFSNEIITTKAPDNCLWIYTEENWKELFINFRKIKLSKEVLSFINAVEDLGYKTKIINNKVTIPAHLCEYAKITEKNIKINFEKDKIIIFG